MSRIERRETERLIARARADADVLHGQDALIALLAQIAARLDELDHRVACLEQPNSAGGPED